MRLLALDQASKTTGYAIFDDGNLVLVDKFTFNTPNIDERLVQIRTFINGLIDVYHIDEVVYEDIQQQNNVANNVQTFKVLAMVYGVVSELLAERKIKHGSILATSWKSTLGIKGRTRPDQKRAAQLYVLDNYGLKVTQDEADAACIGAAYTKKKSCAWAD